MDRRVVRTRLSRGLRRVVAEVYPDYDEWGAPNEIGPSAARRLERVRWNGRSLLLAPLDIQLAVNEKRGLDDRVDAIRRFEQLGPETPIRP